MFVATQQDGEGVQRIGVEVRQETNFGEDVVIQQVRLVDDEHRMNTRTGSECENMIFDRAKHRCSAMARIETKDVAEMRVELNDGHRGVTYIIAFVVPHTIGA